MSETQLRLFIGRLRNNDPSLTALDFHHINGSLGPYPLLGGEALFRELLTVLSMNRTVKSAKITLRFLLGMSEDEKTRLYKALGTMPALEHLHLASSGLAVFGLQIITQALSRTQYLKTLHLHSGHFRDSTYYRTKGTLSTHDEEFVDFCRTLKSLRGLEAFTLEDVEDTFDLNALIRILSTLPNLRYLSIKAFAFSFPSQPRMSVGTLSVICNMMTLRTLSLKRLQLVQHLPEMFSNLQNNTVLENLTLEGYQMDRECGMALANLLQTNGTLKAVHVGFNKLPDECGVAIANALSANTNITTFDFSVNGLGRGASLAFSQVLAANACRLDYLNLSKNMLRDDGCAGLALALHTNTTLKALVLSETLITDISCVALASSLAVNTSLELLDLSNNKVCDHGCGALSRALKSNSSLKNLNLSGNQVGDVGGIAIAMALPTNTTLHTLNLSGNISLGPASYKALEIMILKNLGLTEFEIPVTPPDSTIPSFLKLNRLGRKQLLQEMEDASWWIEVVAKCTEDIHCLYYLIRANPALLRCAEQTPTSVVSSHGRR
jgi:Ran GTPase-activating protein (RanGAP) involved in mRNA processing and transport